MNDDQGSARLTVREVPDYPDITTYADILGEMHIWEGDGWKEESLAWKEGAYIGSHLGGDYEITYSGPQAQELLSRTSINSLANWRIGTSKHLVQTDERGYIANHGLTIRSSEDSFRQFGSFPWSAYQAERMGLDVTVERRKVFILQIAGPRSVQVIERLLGVDIRDVNFLDVRPVSVPGIDAEIEIELSRIGMAGTLAYELRGPWDASAAVYDAVYQAGQEFGIKRTGWRTYFVNHTEGGFPQMGGLFAPSAVADPAFLAFAAQWGERRLTKAFRLTGSVGPEDLASRLRTPFEVNWGWMAKFDHDFLGREAVEAEAANPRRKTVTLRWNKEDVLDVFASQFEKGEEYRNFEFPLTPQVPTDLHADRVIVGDEFVGVSSAVAYSYYYREMLSLSTIDIPLSEVGTEVIIEWGDAGRRIKRIRATVERFPYLDLPSNRKFDLSTIPSGIQEAEVASSH
ncbi:aminomethyltransferase [Microbacterium sp. Leaf288]|uniref:aminomethyltransferase family protein n=1 Tax=Microbacterium sp. Leaf288 TaxID=1736323 RepID=UPI0006F7309E|nr:aminomethyltransferase family protein [Microbacterium sp. Leaf288]KQP69984.1 aminomethyltransferase [Microbacterium sp. Leaf288]